MYVFGGVNHIKNNTRTNQVFKIWLKVPKLKEMAWEAVLSYNKSIKGSTHSELQKLGIPLEFANRVHPSPPSGHGPGTSEHWASEITHPSDWDSATKSVAQLNVPLPIGS